MLAIDANGISAGLALTFEGKGREIGPRYLFPSTPPNFLKLSALHSCQARAETSAQAYLIRCNFGERPAHSLSLTRCATEDMSLAERLICVALERLIIGDVVHRVSELARYLILCRERRRSIKACKRSVSMLMQHYGLWGKTSADLSSCFGRTGAARLSLGQRLVLTIVLSLECERYYGLAEMLKFLVFVAFRGC